jgi:hypothetical protein
MEQIIITVTEAATEALDPVARLIYTAELVLDTETLQVTGNLTVAAAASLADLAVKLVEIIVITMVQHTAQAALAELQTLAVAV